MKLAFSFAEFTRCRARLIAAKKEVSTCAISGAVGTFANISFICDDIQKTYEDLNARGVEFQQPPKKESWGTSAIFKDVDGNTFVMSPR
jgi:adenylosuccinate lyase